MRRAAIAAGLAVLLLSGCSTAGRPAASGPPSATASARPSVSASRTPASTAAPAPPPAAPVLDVAQQRLSAMTLEQKVSSLLMLHLPGTDAAAQNAFAAATGAGGLILMGDNVPGTAEALAAQTAGSSPDAALPLLLGIDEEGGDVTRLPWDPCPGADVLGGEPSEATAAAFSARAAILQAAGVNVNFGIVADISTGPDSFIDSRSFGRDPVSAGDRVAAAASAESVLSTLKHFPGHGAAPGDSHSSVPATAKSIDEWRAFDAVPFERGIAAGAELVMMGHLAYTAVDPAPASLSATWHRVLREELGFDGVIVTDDMLMLQDTGLPEYQDAGENAVRAIEAGNTLLLYVLPGDPGSIGADPTMIRDAVVAAVHSGRIPAAQIDEDALRLLRLRLGLAAG